jgi:hypothetical protein
MADLMTFLKLFQQISGRPAAKKGRTVPAARPATKKQAAGGIPAARESEIARPVDPFLQAQRDAANAENEVAEVSRSHLATLLALPPRTRLSHLADLELTPADKSDLENSVRSLLPRSIAAKLLGFNLAGTSRRLLQRCGYKCMASIVVLAVCGLAAGIAWYNTGERVIVSNETWWVDWTLPDGSNLHGGWKAGFPAIAMRPRNGRVVLRYWLAGRGYATTEVDQDWLIKHSFDHVVASTGAVGAVNPAKRGSL